MERKAILDTGNQKPGRWIDVNGFFVLVDNAGKILAPSDLKGQSPDEIDVSQMQNREIDPQKSQLISTLMAANTTQYPRLQEYLTNLQRAIALGNEPVLEKSYFDKLASFTASYSPIDSKMRDFLRKYESSNKDILGQLGQLIDQGSQDTFMKPDAKPMMPKKENVVNVRKFGLYRFPFLSGEKLYLGDIQGYQTVPQAWNDTGTHFKMWKNINGLPFLVNGYQDDEYTCVNRVLVSQAAKLMGLQCEEVFLGYNHAKPVTLTAFHEAITLLENTAFEMYKLSSNYNYLADQKRAFYFLIQNWVAYAQIDSQTTKERFDFHFVDSNGEVFLSKHEQAMFLTPQLMPRNLMVKLEITKLNYQAIKDMIRRVGDKDIADIVFSSIPDEFVDLHDEVANRMNKTSFQRKKECFDANWMRLVEAVQDFEQIRIS